MPGKFCPKIILEGTRLTEKAETEAAAVAADEREAIDVAFARDLELSSGRVAGVTHEEVLAAIDQALR